MSELAWQLQHTETVLEESKRLLDWSKQDEFQLFARRLITQAAHKTAHVNSISSTENAIEIASQLVAANTLRWVAGMQSRFQQDVLDGHKAVEELKFQLSRQMDESADGYE